MVGASLEADPRARALLELAAAQARGEVVVGGRRIHLDEGDLVEVVGTDADVPLSVFLLDSGRLAADVLQRYATSASVDRTLEADIERDGVIGEDELRSVRRSLWMERLAHALADAERDEEAAPRLGDMPADMRRGRRVRLVPMVLDALAHTALEGDAERVGERLTHRLRWSDGPHSPLARAWAAFGDGPDRPALASVLAKHPAAAPRIAALLRAGVAELDAPGGMLVVNAPAQGTLPPPPPPRRSLFPTARPEPLRAAAVSLAPPRAPRLRLDPGSADLHDEPLSPTPLRRFASPTGRLEDPLWEVELEVARLEQQKAPGPERARALRELARLWRERVGCVEEASRAMREAAAADPTSAELLQDTAASCLAAGDARLALQYADAAVAAATEPARRASARHLRARLHAILGNAEACLEDLCESTADDPANPEPHEVVAGILAGRDDRAGANRHLRLAAACHGATPRAQALLAWAAELHPDHLPTAQEHAAALAADGRAPAAIAELMRSALRQRVPAARRRLRLAAAQHASQAERPDLVAETLEAAFDDDPRLEALHAPLEEALQRAGFSAYRIAILEQVAACCSEALRASWSMRLAEALLVFDGQHESALWVAHDALSTIADSHEALALLRAHADAPRELALLAHGLFVVATAQRNSEPDKAVTLFEELAWLADERMANPRIARMAWEQVDGAGRGDARVRSSIERLGARIAEDTESGDPWSALLGLPLDGSALLPALAAQAEAAPDTADRIWALDRLASMHALRGDARATAVACERRLALAPDSPLAVARWERAARSLRDDGELAHVLSAQAALATSSPAALARWASHLGATADTESALVVAERALVADPTEARSATILVRRAARLAPDTAVATLLRARAALGASRALLQALVHAAAAVGDRVTQRDALEEWCALLPLDAEAALLLLAFERSGGSPDALRRAGERVLAALPNRERLSAAGDAVDHLLTSGARVDALRLLVRIGHSLGRGGGQLARRALELASDAPAEHAIEALEWSAVSQDQDVRAEALIALARLHRSRSDAVGESRALVRVEVGAAQHADALARLTDLLSAPEDRPRLVALLRSALDASSAPDERTARLYDLVAASTSDPADAEVYVRLLVAAHGDDLAGVRTALGTLLSLGEARWAVERHEAIAADCGEQLGGKIALWAVMTAERVLADPALALAVAKRAAVRSPNESALLLTVERLALSARDAASARATYDALIAAAIGPHGRRSLHYRAGRWLERADRTSDALARYLDAFLIAPSMGVAYRAAERIALAAGDAQTLVTLYSALAAAMPHSAVRFDLIHRVANLLLDRLDDRERGFEVLLEANALSETFELDDEVLDRARELAARDPETGRAARDALRAHWQERAENVWEPRARINCLTRLAELLATDFDEPVAALRALERAKAIAAEEELDDALGATFEARFASLGARVAATAVASAPQAARASEAPAERRPSIAAVGPEGVEVLRTALIAEPWRTDRLRRLHTLASETGAAGVHLATGQLLSVFDPLAAPLVDLDLSGHWEPEALQRAIEPTYPEPLAHLVSLLWQRARMVPRFRAPLERYGLSQRDRLTRVSMGPVSDAYATAARALGIHTQIYTVDASDEPVRPVATYPASILSTPHIPGTRAERTFAVARALWLTRPEHALPAVLDEAEARVLLDAFLAAFAPASAHTALDRERKELGAQLWQAIPMRDQKEIAVLLREQLPELRYERLRSAALAAAARAGLLVCGDAAVALRRALADAGVATSTHPDEATLQAACENSAAVASVVRCALSLAYIEALERGSAAGDATRVA